MKKFGSWFITLAAFFVLLSIPNPQRIQAKGPPGNWSEQERVSIDASILFYNSLINIYRALEAVEEGKITDANQILGNTAKSFHNVIGKYKMIQERVKERPINFDGLDFNQIATIALDFRDFNVKVPDTMKSLAGINKQQLQSFEKLLFTIKFTYNDVENRRLIRRINSGIYRVMAMGTSVSEIVAAQQKR